MTVKYPAQIDDTTSLPIAMNNSAPVTGFSFNKLREAVIAIEKELGTNPSGIYTTVKERLQNLENTIGSLKIIELENDLGGSLSFPKVIGLQGNPISATTPNFGDLLFWNGIAWEPSQLNSILPAGTAPGQVLVWDGYNFITSALTQDSILPSYNFNITSGTKEFLSLGQSWTQGFHISLDNYPDTAILTDSMSALPKNVLPEVISSGGTFCESDISYTKDQFNDNVIFTITITSGFLTKQVTNTLIWAQPVYCGFGLFDQWMGTAEAFIKNLDYIVVNNSKQHTFTVNTSTNQKAYFACRSAYGDINFSVNNLQGGFTKILTVSNFDNGYGITESFDLYESDNAGLGEITLNTF
jgi:hypothetical protein